MEPVGTEKLDEDTLLAYVMLRATTNNGYLSFYNASVENTAGQHSNPEVEDLMESVNLVFTYSPLNIHREQKREKSAHDVF